jgi:hypothetical protein
MKKLDSHLKLMFCITVICISISIKPIKILAQCDTDAATLKTCLNNATSGQTILISSDIDLDALIASGDLPLIVKTGVTLEGNYDLLNNPYGIKVTSTYRYSWCDANCNCGSTTPSFCTNNCPGTAICQPEKLFLFKIMPGGSIKNLRIQGGMLNLQEFNQDDLLCGGIYIQYDPGNSTASNIENCEIFGFSYAGIFGDAGSNAQIDHCYIHHVKGTGGQQTTAKGYGMWIQGLPSGGSSYSVNSGIFDDCKAAIDGQGNPCSWYINNCTFSQYFIQEDINKHNISDTINHVCVITSPCFFGTDPADCANATACNGQSGFFCINDVGGGDTHISDCIFHRKYKPNSISSNISLTYPYISQNPGYEVQISNTTFSTVRQPSDHYNNNYGGYARIADNYIESCPWTGDPHLIWQNQDNFFDYDPGKQVTTNSPQPPEVVSQMINPDGRTNSDQFNPDGIPYYLPGNAPELETSPGGLGASNLSYILRFNPSLGAVSGNNSSSDNYFFDQQLITTPTVNSVQSTCTGCTNSPIGLYGTDILAIDGNTASDYHASAWSYKPYSIVDPSTDNYKLIFNIKDSYQEIYNGTTSATNVFKQVELNGHRIWYEDIAEGGDGWERIEIDFSGLDPDGNPIFNHLLTNGNSNVITFSIVMYGAVSTLDVRGLLVWIDDVYLKKHSSADNLIADGGIENCTSSGLTSTPSDDCIWYQPTNSAVSFPGCTSLGRVANSNPIEDYYPDESPMFFIAANPATQASRTAVERKSGSSAIVLKLPALDPATCTDYNPSSQSDYRLISAAVNFDYTDLLSCADYHNAPFSFTTFPTSGPHTNSNFFIDQNITLTGDLSLQGCAIVIESSTGAFNPFSITIPNGITMTVTEDGNGNYSSFFACEKMWTGIIVEEGGTLVIGPGSQVSDAVDAVSCNANGNPVNAIQLRGDNSKPIIFDQNYTSIRLRNGSFPYSSSGNFISRSNFTCVTGYLQREPYIGIIPQNHILLDNVTDLKIGETPSLIRNFFSNAVFGIYSFDSDFEAVKNRFENMKNGQYHCWGCGAGIYMENSGNASNYVTIGPVYNDRNFFENVNYGIVHIGKITTSILYNEFLNVNNTGIAVRWNKDNAMTINHNTFKNVNTGLFLANLSKCPVNIVDNDFDNTGYIPPLFSSFYNTAITIQNPLYVKQGLIDINDNDVINNRIGIHARNVNGISIGANTSGGSGNEITFNQTEYNDFHHGIWLENCNAAKIQENSITKTTGTLPASGYSIEGITLNECVRGLVNMNEINELNTPAHVISACTGTEFHCNDFDNTNYTGEGIKLNASVLPDQGYDDPANVSDQTWDNKWYGYSGNNYGVTGVVNQPFTWYYNPSLPEYFPNPQPGLILSQQLLPTSSDPCAVQAVHNNDERDSKFGYIVGDSAAYTDLITEFGYKEKQNLFSELNQDSSLLAIGTPNDGAFQQFFNEVSGSNIGLFEQIDSLLITGDIVNATTLNTFLSDSNIFEYNRKVVNEILISKVLQDSLLSYADSLILENIAYQNAVTGGSSVFSARSILGLEIHDLPIQLRKFNYEPPVNTAELTESFIYPNPANEFVNIAFPDVNSVRTIVIRDGVSRVLYSEVIKLPKSTINTSIFAPGLYSVIVVDARGKQKLNKLVIIR